MIKYTQEPWGILECDVFKVAQIKNPRKVLFECSNDVEESFENAVRIVNCVNACAGMENPEKEIEMLIKTVKNQNKKIKDLNKKLKEGFKEYLDK